MSRTDRTSCLPFLALGAALALAGCGGDTPRAEPVPTSAATSSRPAAASPAEPSASATPSAVAGAVPGAPAGFTRVSTACYDLEVPVEAAAALAGADDCEPDVSYDSGSFLITELFVPEAQGGQQADLASTVEYARTSSANPVTEVRERTFGGTPGALLLSTLPGDSGLRNLQVVLDVRAEGLTYQGEPITHLTAFGAEEEGVPEAQQVLITSLDSIRFGAGAVAPAPAAPVGAGNVNTQCFSLTVPDAAAQPLAGARSCSFTATYSPTARVQWTAATRPQGYTVADERAKQQADTGEQPYDLVDLAVGGQPALLVGSDPDTGPGDSGARIFEVFVDASGLTLEDGGRPVRAFTVLSNTTRGELDALLASVTFAS